jgi:hypothetical protein
MLFHLFEFISSCISSVFLSEIPFSNNQMVNTKSGGGQDIPLVVCAHIANQQAQAPPHPLIKQWIQQRSSSCRPDAANPKPDDHYSKHASSIESAATTCTQSICIQA